MSGQMGAAVLRCGLQWYIYRLGAEMYTDSRKRAFMGIKKPRWLVGVKFVLRDAGRPFMRFVFFSAHP
jgi:hypothetical protein